MSTVTKKPDAYLPLPDSLPALVCGFFRRLPGEELSHDDVGLKWSVDARNVHVQLKSCVEAGLLARDGSVYTAGPNIERMADRPNGRALLRRYGRNRPSNIAIEELPFEKAPAPLINPVHERWATKLRTMKPGQLVRVDTTHAYVLREVCTRLRKEGQRLRVFMDQPEDDGGVATVRVVCLEAGEK